MSLKRIAIKSIYDIYNVHDAFFDEKKCKLGENILLPIIELKNEIEKRNSEMHTIDMYENIEDIDVAIFFEVPRDSIYTIHGVKSFIKNSFNCFCHKDELFTICNLKKKVKKILIIQEPPIIAPISYNKGFHKCFDIVFTWNDDLVDNKKYFKLNYPQPKTIKTYNIAFQHKKLMTIMCGNKSSNVKNELYSLRRNIINYFNVYKDFDLYGFGWENENLKCYKGSVDSKLDVISNYKFCFAIENYENDNGYITEKLFDCFFANVVPIYRGYTRIKNIIPENTFIDFNKFKNNDELYNYLINIKEDVYNQYIDNIHDYLDSNDFYKMFSVDSFVNTICDCIF